MFKRVHHRRIHTLLQSLDGSLLEAAQCYFGGGTAIVLLLDEYRESLDVDFLCESTDGYRMLRNAIYEKDIPALFRTPVKPLRETRTDQYGIRTVLEVEGVPIKFEIVREGRVALAGANDVSLGVPVLSRNDMFAEKLLANADRGMDTATMSRDVIDLAMMISHWGPVPADAWQKARAAYGVSVERAFVAAVQKIADPDYLQRCADNMHMDTVAVAEVRQVVSTFLASKQ